MKVTAGLPRGSSEHGRNRSVRSLRVANPSSAGV